MNVPSIQIALAGESPAYAPVDVLKGQFSLEGVDAHEIRAVELSVLWHTEGKGDEDMSVHYFERLEPDGDEYLDFCQPRPFTTILPNSPLSYRGFIVKIHWCVRVRLFLARGKEVSIDVPFQLGTVPHPKEVPA